MKKIAVIGIPGGGKTTFSLKLQKITGIDLIHLDKEYWSKNWKRKFSDEEWVKHQKELVKRDSWIIDGNYTKTIDIRISEADTIILFDIPKIRALFRVFKRLFKKPIDKEDGTKEKVRFELLKFIWKYPKQKTTDKVLAVKNQKNIFIIKNNKQAKNLLKKLSGAET